MVIQAPKEVIPSDLSLPVLMMIKNIFSKDLILMTGLTIMDILTWEIGLKRLQKQQDGKNGYIQRIRQPSMRGLSVRKVVVAIKMITKSK